MKIFVGTTEIAGMLHFISSALKECGHEVTTCTDNYGSTFYSYHYDVILNKTPFKRLSKNRYIRKAQSVINNKLEVLRRNKIYRQQRDAHDVYIFIWNGFFKESTKDYEYLKRNNKKIITLFLGSDVRHISAFTQEYQLDVSTWENWFHTTDLNEQIFRLRKAELFSDLIFSLPDQAGLAIRPYHKIYIPFNAKAFAFINHDKKIPKIVHIPSRTGIKGTAFILKVLGELKTDGLSFEFEFVTGVSNDVVLKKLSEADILVDEIYLHGPGTLSLEGMASGCAVATKTMENEVYDEILCNVNLLNLKEKLWRLIVDIDYRRELSVAGRKGVETINDPRRIASDIINKLLPDYSPEADKDYYHPRFFSDKYKLDQNVEISKKNKITSRKVIEKFKLFERLNINRMEKEQII